MPLHLKMRFTRPTVKSFKGFLVYLLEPYQTVICKPKVTGLDKLLMHCS